MHSVEQLGKEVDEDVPQFVRRWRFQESKIGYFGDHDFVDQYFEYIVIKALVVKCCDDFANQALVLLERLEWILVVRRPRYLIEALVKEHVEFTLENLLGVLD